MPNESGSVALSAPADAASAWRAGLSVWTWFAVGVALVIGCLAALISFLLLWPFDRRRAVSGRAFRLGAVVGTRLSPMWRLRVYGALPAQRPRRTVIISNHESAVDMFLLSYLPWEMKWLSKASMFRIPLLGWTMRVIGDVPLVRGDPSSARRAMRQCGRWLERGMPVMIFPEGTRSMDGSLGPFKDGAFRLAIESGADVLPVAVAGARHALRKHDWRMGFARAYASVGEPISTAGMQLEDVAPLKEEARRRIMALQEQCRTALRERSAGPT